MSDENPDDLIILHGPGIEALPDGTHQLLVECPTIVHYITLPRILNYAKLELFKCGFDSSKQYAFYPTAYPDRETATRMLL